jgi:predicted permease
MRRIEAALLGYTFSSSSVPVFGLTVLTPIYGPDTGSAVVGLVALVTNLAQVSIAVFLFESAAPKAGEKPSIVKSVERSAANPLVWAPVLGGLLALLGLHLSPYVAGSLEPLAAAASGVSVFAAGLVLASHRIVPSRIVVVGSLVVLAVQPAVFFAVLKLGGLSGEIPGATVVASAFPTATVAILFAQQYRTAEQEIASIMLVTTLGMVAAIPLSLLASGYL